MPFLEKQTHSRRELFEVLSIPLLRFLPGVQERVIFPRAGGLCQLKAESLERILSLNIQDPGPPDVISEKFRETRYDNPEAAHLHIQELFSLLKKGWGGSLSFFSNNTANGDDYLVWEARHESLIHWSHDNIVDFSNPTYPVGFGRPVIVASSESRMSDDKQLMDLGISYVGRNLRSTQEVMYYSRKDNVYTLFREEKDKVRAYYTKGFHHEDGHLFQSAHTPYNKAFPAFALTTPFVWDMHRVLGYDVAEEDRKKIGLVDPFTLHYTSLPGSEPSPNMAYGVNSPFIEGQAELFAEYYMNRASFQSHFPRHFAYIKNLIRRMGDFQRGELRGQK